MDKILFSRLTMHAPTCEVLSLLRCAVSSATPIKYSSCLLYTSPRAAGRLDEVLVFGPLAQEDLVAIGEPLLRELGYTTRPFGTTLALSLIHI